MGAPESGKGSVYIAFILLVFGAVFFAGMSALVIHRAHQEAEKLQLAILQVGANSELKSS